MFISGLIVGLFIGTTLGVLVMCLMSVAGDADDRACDARGVFVEREGE